MLKKILLGILFVLVLSAIGIVLFAKDFEVKISEKTAQDAINTQIEADPIHKFGVQIKLKEANVDFRSDNTLKFSAELETDAFGYKHKIDGIFQSGLSYKSPRIYLNSISPVSVNIQVDEETSEELNEIKSAARKFLQRQKDRAQKEDTKAALGNVIGKNDDAFQETIIKASYGFFEFVPLYNLNNAGYKGSLASLALKDVYFTDDYAVVTLSPVQALLKILAILGLTLLAFIYLTGSFLMQFGMDRVFNDKK